MEVLMKAPKRREAKKYAIMITIFLLIFSNGCKKNQELSDPDIHTKIENILNLTALAMGIMADRVYERGVKFKDLYEKGELTDNDIDPATMWWSITITDGEVSITAQVRFIDTRGNYHKFYDEINTSIIEAKGSITASGCRIDNFHVEFSNISVNTYKNIELNGDGHAESKQTSCDFFIENVVFKKSPTREELALPKSGRMTLYVEGITVEVYFNNEETATLNYTYNSETYNVDIKIMISYSICR